MREILSPPRKAGYPIIDEADTLLNILHETSFSLGDVRSPEKDDVRLVSELYSILYENPYIKKLGKVDSDPNPNEEAPVLTEKVYFEQLQRPLAEVFLDRLEFIDFDSVKLTKTVRSFIHSLDANGKKLIIDYLCRNKENLKDAQAYL